MFRFYWVIFWNLFRVPYLGPSIVYMCKNPDKFTVEERYSMIKRIVRAIKSVGAIFTRAYGQENLPKEGGYIMFANHQGKYDALGVFHTHKEPCSFVMDEARSHMLVVNQVIQLCDGKRMSLTDVRQSMGIIMEMAEEAAKGKRFLIFPEGGYFHNRNNVKEFKPGSFKSAMKAKVPIVPVALVDSWKAFEGFRVGVVRTQVHYLTPITYKEYKGMKTVEVAELVRQRIVDKIDEVLDARKKKCFRL